jgi:hypothetical protein
MIMYGLILGMRQRQRHFEPPHFQTFEICLEDKLKLEVEELALDFDY